MTGTKRPRGRRALLRGIGLALLALVAPGSATAATAPAPPALSTFDGAGTSQAIAAGPDGATWSLERTDGERHAIVRYGPRGRLSIATLQARVTDVNSQLAPLADGGMGAVVTVVGSGSEPPASTFFARIAADGRSVRLTRLPAAAWEASAFAIAGDGTVWFARACQDALYRWRLGGPAVRIELPRDRCPEYLESGSSLLLGPDGSVWVGNSAQSRIVRRDAHGRLRQWRCSPVGVNAGHTPLALAADPRGGGLAFSEWDGGATAGRIAPSGRLLLADRTGLGAYGADGTLWRAGVVTFERPGVLERIAPSGATAAYALAAPTEAIDVALARDGTPWLLGGTYTPSASYIADFGDIVFGTVARGATRTWAVAPPSSEYWSSYRAPTSARLALGGDGALWGQLERGGTAVVARALPAGIARPRRAVATVRRALARDGRSLTLQVTCAAERGRFCRGTIGLAGAAAAARYVAPGQSGAAVTLRLSSAAAATLRRRGVLPTTAVVRSTGAATTRRVLRLR